MEHDTEHCVALTPTLYMGPRSDTTLHSDLLPANTAEEAVALIQGGKSALLPPHSWALASEVLFDLGCSREWVEHLFRRAGHG